MSEDKDLEWGHIPQLSDTRDLDLNSGAKSPDGNDLKTNPTGVKVRLSKECVRR